MSWYHVDGASVTDHAGTFILAFSSGSSDAWSTIVGTSIVVTACAVVIGALLLLRLRYRSRHAVLIAVAVALVAAGVVGYRIAASPQAPRGVEGAYFEGANSVPAAAGARDYVPTSTASGGAVVAACAAAAAVVAGCVLACGRRRTS